MITLSKSGSTVTFTFDENSGYLQNGTIDVPVNSLSLILDESNMATFRKSASNDIFVSANIAEFGMSKSELEAWYKANMVGSTGGGGGGGVTSGEVQTMIDESISGKADSSSLATVATSGNYNDLTNKPTIPTVSSAITSGDTNAVQGGAVYDQVTIGGGMEEISTVTAASYTSVVMPDCDKFTISAGTAVGDTLTSGGRVINVYDKSTDTFVFSSATVSDMNSNYVTIEGTTADTSIALSTVDGYYFKGDNSMMFKSNYSGGWVVTFYKNSDVEWLKDVVSANTAAISGKADTSAVTQSINAAVSGKQDTMTAGRGINIDTANTISLNVPISASTGTNSIAEGYNTNASGTYAHAEGKESAASGYSSHAEGANTQTRNLAEHASGRFNVTSQANSNFGDSGNTLFSVGNGTADNARHNALEVRQNGDIYCNNGTSDVKLQDYIQYKLVQITQSAYDDLVTGGTVDNSTIYYIVN